MPCYSPLKGYKCAETGRLIFRREKTRETMDVACGQCLGCRLDRSRMWAMRIVHEASLHEADNGNSFVTLTYRPIELCNREQKDEGLYMPPDGGLQVEHFQKFMKRLRKRRPESKLKYFHCGEYGKVCKHGFDLELQKCPSCNVGRPHYHAILFNCSFDDLEPYAKSGETVRYTSRELENTWKYGFVDVGEVTFQSAAYTARYIMKKLTGQMAEGHYRTIAEDGEIHEIQPEYATMSNGIGKDWYTKYEKDIWPHDEVPVPGHGMVKKVPRYYEELYKAKNEIEYEKIKNKRQKFRKENAEEYTAERLYSKYKVKKAATAQLMRQL